MTNARSPNRTRRSFLHAGLGLAGAASGLTGASPLVAAASRQSLPASGRIAAEAAVMIDANEYPEGPSAAAQQAIATIASQGGRYLRALQMELLQTLSQQIGVGVDHLVAYAGSTVPLDYTMLAFTSPSAALVTANPTYESGWRAALRNGAELIRVPLRGDGAHDVRAMCAASSRAGVIYICNPNNPTGALTTRADLEYALAHKPKGSVLVVDEAYIHFADSAVSAVDMVAAGEDVVVLRSFSKLYGMAGIRLGYAVARPALLGRLMHYSVNSLPVTAVAAGLASLRDPLLVPQRRQATRAIRVDVMNFLQARGHRCSASQSNCFMVDVGRLAAGFISDMASHGVFVGRSWDIWPQQVRITVGSVADMERFKAAFVRVAGGHRGAWPRMATFDLAGQCQFPCA